MKNAKGLALLLVLLSVLVAIYIYPFIVIGLANPSHRYHYIYMASNRPLLGRNYLIRMISDTPGDYDQACAMAILLGYKETGHMERH